MSLSAKYRPLLTLALCMLITLRGSILFAQETDNEQVVYMVQLKASPTQLDKAIFEIPDVIELKLNGDDYYRYFSGRFNTYTQAKKHQLVLRDTQFKDCFVVAYQGNKKIQITRELINRKAEDPPKETALLSQAKKEEAPNPTAIAVIPSDTLVPTIDEGTSPSFETHDNQASEASEPAPFIPDSTNNLALDSVDLNKPFECNTAGKQAQELYLAGYYDKALEIIQRSLAECHPSRKEQEALQILAIQCNIENDKVGETMNSFRRLFKVSPNFYSTPGTYQEDFYQYYNLFKVKPLLSIGLRGGGNVPIIQTKKVFSILDSVDYGTAYKGSVGYQAGVFAEMAIYGPFALQAGGNYSMTGYDRVLGEKDGRYDLYDFHESFHFISVPIGLKCDLLHGTKKSSRSIRTTSIYAKGGAFYALLQKSSARAGLNYTIRDPLTGANDAYRLNSNAIDTKAYRNSTNMGAYAGMGFRYQVNNLSLSLELDYQYWSEDVINTAKRFSNKELIYNFYYVDNDFTLNRLDAAVSIAYTLSHAIKSK